MKKNQKGFTLVEVIVVAIIVAILAAVAVPLYLQYVTNSRTNSAANAAGAIATFCGACVNASGAITGTSDGAQMQSGGMLTCTSTSMGNTESHVPDNIDITVSSISSSGYVLASHEHGGGQSSFNY